MKDPLKLVSLNIEGNRHLAEVPEFVRREQADVVFFYEVLDHAFPALESALGMKGIYVPISRVAVPKGSASFVKWGSAFFSRLPPKDLTISYYSGTPDALPEEQIDNVLGINRCLLSAIVEKDGERFSLGATHFTWSADGKATDPQRGDLKKFLKILEGFPEIILYGDFNAPRGREIFDAIAARYKDAIPPEYKTSLDGKFHRAGQLPFMVDGLFTTPGYRAQNVRLVSGLSDHCAVVGDIYCV